ncbi:MAG: DUF4010 domain-containing protein [Planctomycetota bacterium]|nr:DUF4010 domain-containing protein [Planctomycetota bacterium]
MTDLGSFLPPQVVSLGTALGVGLLIGLERERHPDTVAGVRTFGLAGLIGGLSALLSNPGYPPWPLLVATMLAGVAGIWGGIAARRRPMLDGTAAPDDTAALNDIGLTTAFALVATTLLGGYAVLGDRSTTLVVAGVLFLLLYLRDPLHTMIRHLGAEDVRAIATFVLIALVVLPVLPDRDMGPFGAVNPRMAWMLVVLVVSLSLAGYVAQAFLGDRGGTIATGLLGGLVSSTATTVGAARRAREDGLDATAAATALLACAVLPARIAVLVAVVAQPLFERVAWWLGAIAALTLLGAYAVLRAGVGERSAPLAKPRNPTQLRSALAFAAAFVLIRIATRATVAWGGIGAFLTVAGISGITDMDAIAMSAAREVTERTIDTKLGMQAVLVALLVNSLFKLTITRALGTKAMFLLALPWLVVASLVAAIGAFIG